MNITDILRSCIAEGNVVKLPPIQLSRENYLKVKKELELIGGKWKGGKTQGFVFEYDPSELLAQLADGEKRNLKKEYQFFETPAALADKLVAYAEMKITDKVLEPSAGRGAIVKAVHRRFPGHAVHGYELMDINRTFLGKLPDFVLLGNDFLVECDQHFDVIIANPPFAKNQDIDHIMKMHSILPAGGRLVSIASIHWQFASGRKETAFREWLQLKDAQIIPVPRGAFEESGTIIETCIIVIRN